MKSAIVTGASGFIGYHLISHLVSRGVEVWAVCRRGSKTANRLGAFKGIHIVSCDLKELDTLPEKLSGTIPEVFYHLAWEGASGALRGDYSVQISNAAAVCKATEAAYRMGCRKIVAVGTVYERLYEGISCSNSFCPPSFYVLGKQFAHDMSAQLSFKLGLDLVWCTFFHPIGRYMKQEQLMAYTIASLMQGNPPEYGPAQQPFDIIAVEDLAQGLYLAGKTHLKNHVYYIGSGTPRKLEDYLHQAQQILNPSVPLGIGKKEDDGIRFDAAWLYDENFIRETRFHINVPYEEAVRRTAEWLKTP